MGGVDDPTCAACPVAQALREQRDDLLAEIARLRGLGNLPGAVRATHTDDDGHTDA
jgi:hypothetical protein